MCLTTKKVFTVSIPCIQKKFFFIDTLAYHIRMVGADMIANICFVGTKVVQLYKKWLHYVVFHLATCQDSIWSSSAARKPIKTMSST